MKVLAIDTSTSHGSVALVDGGRVLLDEACISDRNHGCALVPLLTVDTSDESVRVIDMTSQLPPRLIGVAWHRDRYRSAAARAFVELARDQCAELQRATLSAA